MIRTRVRALALVVAAWFSRHHRPFILLAIAFVLYFLVSKPVESAGLIRSALDGASDAASRLAEFIRALVR